MDILTSLLDTLKDASPMVLLALVVIAFVVLLHSLGTKTLALIERLAKERGGRK